MSDEPLFSVVPYAYPDDAYPSRHPKGSFWATDIGWDILDCLPVGTLDNEQRAFICGLIGGALSKERAEADSLHRTFDLQWEADQRAIKRWQAAHPDRPNVWPDRADMVVWLMEQHEAKP